MHSLGMTILVCLAGLLFTEEPKQVVKLSKDEQKILDLLNETRKKEKLSPLRLNPLLIKAAKLHSENMARQEKMSHKLDGKGVGDRVTAVGYDWRVVRENLASAEGDADAPAPSPEEIHKSWMESKGHRTNILDARVTEIGVSMVRSKKGTYFYTQVFACPLK